MRRQQFSNTKPRQVVHYKVPRRELWGKECSANQAFRQAQRAFRKHNWRLARLVPSPKIGE